MVEISFDDVVKLYDENYFTLEGVYAYCKEERTQTDASWICIKFSMCSKARIS